MPRTIDKEKYERILKRLAKGETQAHIVEVESCSYATIASAKQWDNDGRPASLSIKKPNRKSNTTQVVISMPNYWLGILNEKINEGIWQNYSDAMLYMTREYFNVEGMSNGKKLRELKDAQQKGELGSIRKEMRSKLGERKMLVEENAELESRVRQFVDTTPEIDAFIAMQGEQGEIVMFQSETWPSASYKPLLKGWRRSLRSMNVKKRTSIEFNGEKYIIMRNSPEQVIFAHSSNVSENQPFIKEDGDTKISHSRTPPPPENFICGLMAKINNEEWRFLVKVNTKDENKTMGILADFNRVVKGIAPISSTIEQIKQVHPEIVEKYGEQLAMPEFSGLLGKDFEKGKALLTEMKTNGLDMELVEAPGEKNIVNLTQVLHCPACDHEQQFPTHCWTGNSAFMEFEDDHFTCEKCKEEVPIPTCPKCDKELVPKIKTIKPEKPASN